MRVQRSRRNCLARTLHACRARAALGAVCLSAALAAPALAEPQKVELPVSRLAMFSSGVAYYECEANVDGAASAELRFRTAQINDILKSMIVQDFDGGTIGVVSYASQDPIEKTLRSFGVDITGKPGLGQLLDQLRGEPVELTGGRAVSGVIMGVERQKLVVDQQIVEVDLLNVLTDVGMVQLRLHDLQGVRLSNAKVDAELRKALATLASAHDADKKSVTLRFEGNGKRRVRVAYLLEAPIWKTSYRLALDPEGQPFLQGWATVENATEEDWRDVQLSLVSGRPISFTMDLYTPIYVPRPHEELELYASLRPPQYEGGIEDKAEQLDRAAGLAVAKAPGAPAALADAVPRHYYRGTSGGRFAADEEDGAPAEMALGESGVSSVAQAAEAGELFQYTIRTPVSLPRQHSAMLPIVNQAVKGEKVSIYNPGTHPKHPLNGLELVNATGLHLMQGPITVFEGGVYAGDAKLPDMKPDEKRLIGYALDLGVEVKIEAKSRPDEITQLRIARGVLIHTHKYVDEREYLVKNKLDKPRTVLIEQEYSDDWKLVAPEKPYERTSDLSRFKVEAPGSKTVSQRVVLETIAHQSVAIAELNFEQIRFYQTLKVITPAVRQALEQVVALRTELERTSREREATETRVNETVAEQARVRENIKTLQGGTDAHRRQMDKFDALETQIETQRGQLADIRTKEAAKRQELESFLLQLEVN